MSFTNLYYKRTAGTPKACYVCYKPTTTVLATINTVDFLYTCPGHLSDSGFATLVKNEGSGAASAMSAEEIAKVKAEWEEKQKRKLEKEKEKAKETEKNKEKEKEKESKSEDKDKAKEESKSPAIPGSLSTSPAPVTPTHERYALHRDFFAMRQGEHKKRRQVAQAKELAPRLPGAPRGELGL